MFFYSTSYLVFMIPGFILVMLAQLWVRSTYNKWSKVKNYYGMTGVDAAHRLIKSGNLNNVSIEEAPGKLSDHYDSRKKVLRLSKPVAQGQSIAALAITAHEIGHAQQDKLGYFPLRLRAALVPAANIGSTLGWIFILIGLIMQSTFGNNLAWVGVGAFALGTIFALATLPVELNASSRAKALLAQSGLITNENERGGVNAVLNAAAFTYIAALAASLLQLLYYASLIRGLGRRRR